MTAQNIYLVRHAKPEFPGGGGIYYGRLDFPICDEGKKSAAALAPFFADKEFAAVFVSPLIRTRQTLNIIKPGCEGTPVEAFTEINLGSWEGKTFDEVRPEWDEIYEKPNVGFSECAPPGGESFLQLQQRTVPAFEKILDEHKNGDLLFVLHAGVIWSLMCRMFDFNLDNMYFYPHDYCGVHCITKSGGLLRLAKYNWSPTPDLHSSFTYSKNNN